MISECRVCGSKFYDKPLLILGNMPKSAQYFPDASSINDDKGISLEVVQCSGCGLIQLSNNAVSYYKESIRTISSGMMEFRLNQFKEFVSKYNLKGKKFIEIGCGNGEYLALLNLLGIEAYGLEYAIQSVQNCQRQNLKVVQGFIDNPLNKLANAPFYGFAVFNFLEHLPEPNTFLKGIYNNLDDNAIGIIEVPNFDMILHSRLCEEFISDHLLYFTKDTLISCLTRNGFEILDCKEIWHDYIISVVIRKRGQTDLSGLKTQLDNICKAIKSYISYYPSKSVGVWGAGHQALMLLSQIDRDGKIKYVVDSAKFKQGKYTQVSHLSIVSPSTFYKDNLDAVIIMAGSYSDEVCEDIKHKLGRKIAIAVVRDYGLEYLQ